MRVSVDGNEPGEITDKLPEIVRQLRQLDEHDLCKAMPLVDPIEADFPTPAALAMYRAAKAAAAARVALLTADLRAKLEG